MEYTIEQIAEKTGKTVKNVKRDIRIKTDPTARIKTDPTARIKTDPLCKEDVLKLPYGWKVLLPDMEETIKKKQATINQQNLEIQYLKEENEKLHKRLDTIENNNKKQEMKINVLLMQNERLKEKIQRQEDRVDEQARILMAMHGMQTERKITTKELKKLRGMLHEDRLRHDINAPFRFISKLMNK